MVTWFQITQLILMKLISSTLLIYIVEINQFHITDIKWHYAVDILYSFYGCHGNQNPRTKAQQLSLVILLHLLSFVKMRLTYFTKLASFWYLFSWQLVCFIWKSLPWNCFFSAFISLHFSHFVFCNIFLGFLAIM